MTGEEILLSFFAFMCYHKEKEEERIVMERAVIEQAIDRVRQMEQCFDLLQQLAQENPAPEKDALFQELLAFLTQYYHGGQWLQDYELDEQGLLPRELKRGVLAQDAVYDLLEHIGNNRKEETSSPG